MRLRLHGVQGQQGRHQLRRRTAGVHCHTATVHVNAQHEQGGGVQEAGAQRRPRHGRASAGRRRYLTRRGPERPMARAPAE
jgi:hypothetical protein